MEYLNDEMDDLFRKAGENYPLKTTDSDWDGILGRLQPQVGGESLISQESGKKRNKTNRRFFWLLLLLPLGLFSLNYFYGTDGKNKIFSTGKTTAIPLNSEKGKVQRDIPSSSQNIKSSNPQEKKADNTVINNAKSLSRRASNPLDNSLAGIPAIKQENTLKANVNTKSIASVPGNKEKKNTPATAGNKEIITVESASTSDEAIKIEKPAQMAAGKETIGQPNSIQAEKSIQAVSVKDSVKLVNSNQKNKKSIKRTSAKEKGIFISLVAGPDFSSIKFQPVKNVGYSIGLLAGFRFNKHISLEAGVLWDKKQYYSDGKYFNKSKLNIPYSVNIKDLDGNCNMFEIPVSFRYDFSFNPKGRFFSTAGLSAYLMKKENYEYNAESYGSSWIRKASYNNSGNTIFSILQLSAGYEYNWGKIGRIRVEPYLKIPLTGVGIGSLPISSAGLHLGITHPFR